MAAENARATLIFILYISVVFTVCFGVDQSEFLNKCISSKYHKNVPGPEGIALKALQCKPWEKKSCCTWNTTDKIYRDGTLSLHGIVLDQCPLNGTGKMSDKCKKHFQRDTCFYECSPNLGPWIVPDPISKITRKERIVGVPLCASDCIDWFHDCLFDYTCNDNWGKNWIWKNKGSPKMCPPSKSCKKFSDYFSDAKEFCEKLFNGSFKYESDESSCMDLTPKGTKNEAVARKKAQDLAKASGATKIIRANLFFIVAFTVVPVLLKFS